MAIVLRTVHQAMLPAGLIGLSACLSGCQFRPALVAASAYMDKTDVVVQIELRASDANKIMQRELYARLTLINCDGSGSAFPMDPPIEGGVIPGASSAPAGRTVRVTGRAPVWIYAKYSKPCVFLRGGGYLTGTVESEMAPIVLKRGAGTNNSSNPTPLRGSP